MHRISFSLSFLLAVACLTGCRSSDAVQAPEFKFTAVDGRKVDLADLRGKVVLIDFWATWCPPCRVIGPDLVPLYQKYHGQGLEIIGVSVDSDKSAMLDFVKKEGMAWPQYFDGNGMDNALADKYGVEVLPTLVLIDKMGRIVTTDFTKLWFVDGGLPIVTSDATHQKVDAAVEKLLK